MYEKFVIKKYKEGEIVQSLNEAFNSIEEHSRKMVQMHSLTRHFTLKFEQECPKEYGKTFSFTKLYFGQTIQTGECVTT